MLGRAHFQVKGPLPSFEAVSAPLQGSFNRSRRNGGLKVGERSRWAEKQARAPCSQK